MINEGQHSTSYPETIPFESEIDFSNPNIFVESVPDSELFKYLLTDDIGDSNVINEQLLYSNSSPNSYNDSGSSPFHSPQPSPETSPELSLNLVSNQNEITQDLLLYQYNDSTTNSDALLVPVKQELPDKTIVPTYTVVPSSLQSVNPLPAIEVKADGKNKGTRKRERPQNKETIQATQELAKVNAQLNSVVGRNLSVEEEKQLKRQKRLIKNRESAQLSRLRKKIYIEELERKVSHLTNETENLTKQVSQLSSDKKKLQEEVVYLQNIIKQSPDLSAALIKRSTTLSASSNLQQPKNMKAAGVCLLIMLFSVGLLFNSKEHGIKLSRATREEVPQVVPKSTSMYNGRVLQSLEEEEAKDYIPNLETPSYSITTTKKHSRTESSKSFNTIKTEDIDLEDWTDSESDTEYDLDTNQIKPLHDKKRIKVDHYSREDEDRLSLVPLEESKPSSLSMKSANSEVVVQRDPTTSYIYCPDANYIPSSSRSPNGPEMIALLLPASVLNSNVQQEYSQSLLEISCSVLNLHMWPLQNVTTASPTTR